MRYGSPEEAKAIVQGLLDGVDTAYMTGDFSEHMKYVHVPHHIRSESEAFPIRNEREMEIAFRTFKDHTDERGAVSCKRTCISAKFKGRDKIEALHTVGYYDANGELSLPLTETTTVTMHIGLNWKICASTNTTTITTGAMEAVRASMAES